MDKKAKVYLNVQGKTIKQQEYYLQHSKRALEAD
jgi:hypothetical protein